MSAAGTVVTIVTAVFFTGMGIYALATPARLMAPFGIALDSATARSEVRAVYGGFGVATGAVLAVAVADPQLRPGVLTAVAAALAGMAFGRLVSALDGRSRFYPNWFYFGVEAVGAAAVFVVV